MKKLSTLDKADNKLILSNRGVKSSTGAFAEYQMAVCTSPGKRDVDLVIDEKDCSFLGKSLEDYQVGKFIVMKYDSYEDLIGSYFSCFVPDLMQEYKFQPILMRMAWKEDNDNNDEINKLPIGFHHPLIFERLKKTNLLTEEYINGRWGFYIRLLSNGPFVIADKFGWMMKDKEIEEKFQKIGRIIELLLQREKNCMERFQQYFPQFVIEIIKPSNIRSLEPSKNQKSSKITIVNNTPTNTNNIKERLKLKGQVVSLVREKERTDKEAVLERFNQNQRVINVQSICKSFYPCKLTAYLFFEEVLNHACSAAFSSFEGNSFEQAIQVHQTYVTLVLVEILDLLYPHVEEIPKAFGFDLEKDPLLKILWNEKERLGELVEKEIEEYEALAQQMQQLKLKKLENSKQAIKPQVNKVNINNNANLENVSEIKAPEEIHHEEIIGDKKNADLMAEETRNVEAVQKEEKTGNPKIKKEETNLEKQTKKEEKEKSLQERHAERAAQIYKQHKIEQEEEERAKEIKRMERIKNFHDLPSTEFVEEKIISVFRKKKGGNADNFKKVFAEINNNRTLNKDQALSLALYIYETILKPNNIGCADDFYNEVCVRAHYRHTDGHKFPIHYVDILRSTFVIFGIFPKDWQPQTKEDFDAMNKYLQRTIDKLLYKKKTVRGNIDKLLSEKEKIETALKRENNTNDPS